MSNEQITRTVHFGPVYENRRAGVTNSGVKHSFVETIRDEHGTVKVSITHTLPSAADAEVSRARMILDYERTQIRA